MEIGGAGSEDVQFPSVELRRDSSVENWKDNKKLILRKEPYLTRLLIFLRKILKFMWD